MELKGLVHFPFDRRWPGKLGCTPLMIGTIRKHQTWLWAVIVTATIVSFVMFFSPTSRYNNGGGRSSGNFGAIDGERISETEYFNTVREVYLRHFFSTGEWPDRMADKSNFDEQRETYQWLFIIRKLDQYNIHVDTASVAKEADYITRQFTRGQAVPLDEFAQKVLQSHADVDDFERYLRHDLGLRQLISVIGLSGQLVTPDEAKELYLRENQELATEAVFFLSSNYLAQVPAPLAKDLAVFYTNQMAAYRVPDRIQVSYVRFAATNYAAEADKEMARQTNLNATIEQVARQRTNYYADAKTPEAVRQKVRGEVRTKLEQEAAYKAANEFATRLFDMDPMRPENLATLAKSSGLAVRVTQPFDEETGPAEFDAGPNFTKVAFSLSPTNQPFSESIPAEDGAYIVAIDRTLPSEIPPFSQIQDRVSADYRHIQALLLARQAGTNFAHTVMSGMAKGQTFAAICAAAKIKPLQAPPLSLSTRTLPEIEDHISLGGYNDPRYHGYKQLVFSTHPGTASDFDPIPNDGGVIVYVERELPIDQTKMTADLPSYTTRVRQQREQEAFNQWFSEEATKSLRDVPWAQRKPGSIAAGQKQG